MDKYNIEIDEEVFRFLQSRARPLVDTPNDVLRRLLLTEHAATGERGDQRRGEPMVPGEMVSVRSDPQAFVERVLKTEFGSGFQKRPPYRLMFGSADALVYFQNFNKQTSHLWYRVTENPWRDLRESQKNAWICFTNPAERYAFLLPVADIQERVGRIGWDREYLEVNIDPATCRWSELDWDLSDYRKVF